MTAAQPVIRVNQLGYLPDAPKVAVWAATESMDGPGVFRVRDAYSGDVVFEAPVGERFGAYGPFSCGYRLDFTSLSREGIYVIEAGHVSSPIVRIGWWVYDGSAEVPLQYLRQQRCGFNPFLRDSCHTQDGFMIYHPTRDSSHIDVTGGWHDASDYLQYVATSAHATAQLLFAYRMYPQVFGDRFGADGLPGANGTPDVLDEAAWGLRWLEKMNPDSGVMFQQIADDRDHAGFRLPTEDPVTYGKGRERPVYFVTGKPQGIFENKNRSTGVASTAAKFSSAFTLGASVFGKADPSWSHELSRKGREAYGFAMTFPGVSQTAPCRAPYFYEEGNWVDDMQFAAALLGEAEPRSGYLDSSVSYGAMEPVTPWMGADTARHYEWYPFVNIGRYVLAASGTDQQRRLAGEWMREGIERVRRRGMENMFGFGIPFIWCSNNLVSAMIGHLRMYRTVSGDSSYLPMESSLVDWLFGTNPWGTSMICGFPSWGDTPEDPHSAFSHHYGYPIDGGLVDGPVYGSIFRGLIGLHLSKPDPYAAYQSDLAVYHDDWGDYSTNEPTMDGTASLAYVLAGLESDGRAARGTRGIRSATMDHGAITRMDSTRTRIYLTFTGHEWAEGGEQVRKVLKQKGIRASFFFTGDFYRNARFEGLIRALRRDGHYLGAHSDRHLLYASWERRDSTLITRQQWWADLQANYREMSRFGMSWKDARFFMPPYEYYNDTISAWATGVGLTLVNMTAGSVTNADYTTPSMGVRYRSSGEIERRLFELEDASGLGGYILLVHIGTDPERTDKLYDRLGSIVDKLRDRGYSFGSFSDLE